MQKMSTSTSLKDATKGQKLINVGSSSIVDLKAELFRKREEVRQQKTSEDSATISKNEINDNCLYSEAINKNKLLPKRILESIKQQKTESGSSNKRLKGQQFQKESNTNDEQNEQEHELALQKSRMNLERKAKLYEQMTKGLIKVDDEDENILVNFQQKHSMSNNDEGDSDSSHNEDTNSIEYVDQFGRTRKVTREEYEKLERERIEEEKEDNEEQSIPDYEDNRQQQSTSTTTSNIHYQHVREGEVRDHGVAFYAFSDDEQTRAKQMEMLEQLRKETEAKKSEKQRIKDKRKQMIRTRLEKIAARKGISLPEEIDDDDVQETNPSETIRWERATLVPNLPKSSGPREWDRGKIGCPDEPYSTKKPNQSPFYSQSKYQEKLGKERNPEFAPPQSYFASDSRKSNDSRHFKSTKSTNHSNQAKSKESNNLDINSFISGIRKKS